MGSQGAAPHEALENPVAFNFAVSIMGLVIWRVLFMLFTCPCVQVDRSMASPSQVRKAARITAVSEYLAYALVALGMLGLLAHVVYFAMASRRSERIYTIALGR